MRGEFREAFFATNLRPVKLKQLLIIVTDFGGDFSKL